MSQFLAVSVAKMIDKEEKKNNNFAILAMTSPHRQAPWMMVDDKKTERQDGCIASLSIQYIFYFAVSASHSCSYHPHRDI